jgi:regulator of protease activity HflC (stomatin/prohibitin superfamily)
VGYNNKAGTFKSASLNLTTKAEAIKVVQMANAEGIRYFKEAGADEAVLTIKKLEAFEKAANGNATKIIIPSELQGVAGLAKSVVEISK